MPFIAVRLKASSNHVMTLQCAHRVSCVSEFQNAGDCKPGARRKLAQGRKNSLAADAVGQFLQGRTFEDAAPVAFRFGEYPFLFSFVIYITG